MTEPLFRINEVSRRYRERTVLALKDVVIPKGKVTWITGPSGCGKSTLFQILALLDGHETAASGALVANVAVSLPNLSGNYQTMDGVKRRALRRRFGFLFQDGILLDNLTVLENIRAATRVAGTSVVAASDVRTLLGKVGLESRIDALPGELSGGERQRVALLRATVHHPDVLFADEPTANLDAGSSKAVLGFLKDWIGQNGATLLVVSHDRSVGKTAEWHVALKPLPKAQDRDQDSLASSAPHHHTADENGSRSDGAKTPKDGTTAAPQAEVDADTSLGGEGNSTEAPANGRQASPEETQRPKMTTMSVADVPAQTKTTSVLDRAWSLSKGGWWYVNSDLVPSSRNRMARAGQLLLASFSLFSLLAFGLEGVSHRLVRGHERKLQASPHARRLEIKQKAPAQFDVAAAQKLAAAYGLSRRDVFLYEKWPIDACVTPGGCGRGIVPLLVRSVEPGDPMEAETAPGMHSASPDSPVFFFRRRWQKGWAGGERGIWSPYAMGTTRMEYELRWPRRTWARKSMRSSTTASWPRSWNWSGGRTRRALRGRPSPRGKPRRKWCRASADR